jgi:hypothetical protein
MKSTHQDKQEHVFDMCLSHVIHYRYFSKAVVVIITDIYKITKSPKRPLNCEPLTVATRVSDLLHSH